MRAEGRNCRKKGGAMLRMVLIGTALLAVSAIPAHAQWCALYQGGGRNCYFKTQSQCLASISGVGGTCSPDGSVAAPEVRERPQRRVEPKKKPEERRAAKPVTRPAVAAPPEAARPAPTPPPAPTPAMAPSPAMTPTPSGAVLSFDAARKLVLDGQYQAGLAALQRLGFNEHPDVAAYIGLAYNKLGRPDQARVWYDTALNANPGHLLTLSFDGMLHAEQGNVRGAQNNLEKLRTLCGGTCNEYLALEAVLAAQSR